jgi:heme-degrading monooxygenase HmoA
MVVTIFRSRLRPGIDDEYGELAERMYGIASSLPGFVSSRDYAGADGERVAIVEFASEAEHAAWRDHPEHRRAQRLGRERFYAEYRIQVCRVDADRTFRKEG